MNWFSSFFKTEKESPVTVVWLHGANQTYLSFSYLREKCKFSREYCVNYSSSNKFSYNLEKIVRELEDIGPVFVIGHSMGGLYGLHLTQHVDVIGGVSISTPFGGSATADWAKYIVPSYALFKDIGRKSPPVIDGMKIKLNIPWTQIISTEGAVPYHGSENDGVVTIESMEARTDVEKIKVPYTHYEVVSNEQVADIVKQKYRAISAPPHSV